METTTTDIHGHEVLDLVHSHAGTFTRALLAAEVTRRWGAEARFCTCCAGGMTLNQLLEFLVSHGKIVEHDGRLRTDVSQVCAH